jgi:hypothetical protein
VKDTREQEEIIREATGLISQVSDINLVKYFIAMLLKHRTKVSLKTVAELPNKPSDVLAGITVNAIDIITNGSDVDLRAAAVEMWTNWLPWDPELTGRDLEGTLAAFQRLGGIREEFVDMQRWIEFLKALIRCVPVNRNRPIVKTVVSLDLSDDAFLEIIGGRIGRELNQDILKDVELLSGWLMVWCNELTKEELDTVDQAIDNLMSADKNELVHAIPVWRGEERSDDPFSQCPVATGMKYEKECTRIAKVIVGRHMRLNRPLLVALFVKHNNIKSSRQFFRSLYPVVVVRFRSDSVYRRIGSEALEKLAQGIDELAFLQKHAESIVDSVISDISDLATNVIYWMVRYFKISIGARLDLARKIMRSFRPRDIPVWALEVLSAIAGSLTARSFPTVAPSEETLLSTDELIANELIGRIKYVIGTDFGPPQIALEKSIFGVLICKKAISVFTNLPRIQIVKLCEIMDMMKLFTADGKTDEEFKIRLLILAQLILVVCHSDRSVADFFAQRFQTEVWPLFLNTKVNVNDESDLNSRFSNAVQTAVWAARARPGFLIEDLLQKLESKFSKHSRIE